MERKKLVFCLLIIMNLIEVIVRIAVIMTIVKKEGNCGIRGRYVE